MRGVLPFLPNASALDGGFAALWGSAVVVNRSTGYAAAQGVQWDASYQFHGPQLQIASYGQDFSGEMLLMAEVRGLLGVGRGAPLEPQRAPLSSRRR